MVRLLSAGAACVALCIPVSVMARKALLRENHDAVLSSEPVVLAQLSKAVDVKKVPCETIQLKTAMTENSFVRMSGAGWSEGPLNFQVSEQMTSEKEDKGQKQLYGISCYPTDDSETAEEDKKGKCFSTDFTNTTMNEKGEAVPEVKEIDLPINSREDAFMFVCTTTGRKLICDVYAYDNRGTEGWKSRTIEADLKKESSHLGFRVQGSGVTAPKAYVTTDVSFDTVDSSLGCDASALETNTEEQPAGEGKDNLEAEESPARRLPEGNEEGEKTPEELPQVDDSADAPEDAHPTLDGHPVPEDGYHPVPEDEDGYPVLDGHPAHDHHPPEEAPEDLGPSDGAAGEEA
ncbi:mic2-associated protein m2ap [Cystoisospora suis]|uniref:Mic2-associated protein m2ap n=1 Tax=Cystoisospora suis TaxID=483139 RepID=A0A2C6KKQ0_9APIC|nr:mic2-associated protein m2ap [Cystoisospora suis]